MPNVEPQAVPDQTPLSATTPSRLMSLDALRGFDMFWIVGAEEIVHALHKVSPSGFVNLLTGQMTHKDWEGVTFYDLIFPLFVFIVGASLVFSLSKTIAELGKSAALKRIFWRSLLLYLIGIFTYGGFADGIEKIRLLGVLQRIALCYFFTGLIFCTFRLRGMIVACVALLVGYWALMTFVPVPGVGAGNFQQGANLANYVDKQFLPLRKWDGDHDPEGLLSTLPAIATCLLGVFAGLLLKSKGVFENSSQHRSSRGNEAQISLFCDPIRGRSQSLLTSAATFQTASKRMDEQKKVNWLALAGVVSLALGFLWGLQFPVIKKIWTSSYVLVAAGYSCLFLAAFHQIIEIWGYRKWAMPFVWIGTNAITIYLAHNIIDFGKLAERLVGGPIKESFGNYGQVLVTMVVLAMSFLLVRFLYRRKLFLRL